ncbi:MAG: hypothetical protein M1548_10140 [Actinobacteria bacterium]|nr:hypothetical protein [Actinomycetota bacterium]
MSRGVILAGIALFTIILNLPFGRYRAGVTRFCVRWWLAIHLPIPAIFALRHLFGFDWHAIPILFAAAVTGQVLGSRLFLIRRPRMPA